MCHNNTNDFKFYELSHMVTYCNVWNIIGFKIHQLSLITYMILHTTKNLVSKNDSIVILTCNGVSHLINSTGSFYLIRGSSNELENHCTLNT